LTAKESLSIKENIIQEKNIRKNKDNLNNKKSSDLFSAILSTSIILDNDKNDKKSDKINQGKIVLKDCNCSEESIKEKPTEKSFSESDPMNNKSRSPSPFGDALKAAIPSEEHKHFQNINSLKEESISKTKKNLPIVSPCTSVCRESKTPHDFFEGIKEEKYLNNDEHSPEFQNEIIENPNHSQVIEKRKKRILENIKEEIEEGSDELGLTQKKLENSNSSFSKPPLEKNDNSNSSNKDKTKSLEEEEQKFEAKYSKILKLLKNGETSYNMGELKKCQKKFKKALRKISKCLLKCFQTGEFHFYNKLSEMKRYISYKVSEISFTIENYQESINNSTIGIMSVEPKISKFLLLRAKSFRMNKEYSSAINDCRVALSLDNTNNEIENELNLNQVKFNRN